MIEEIEVKRNIPSTSESRLFVRSSYAALPEVHDVAAPLLTEALAENQMRSRTDGSDLKRTQTRMHAIVIGRLYGTHGGGSSQSQLT